MISLRNRFYVCHNCPLSLVDVLLQKIFLVEKSDYSIIELLWFFHEQKVAHTFPPLQLEIRRKSMEKLFRVSRPKRRLRQDCKHRHVDLVRSIKRFITHALHRADYHVLRRICERSFDTVLLRGGKSSHHLRKHLGAGFFVLWSTKV